MFLISCSELLSFGNSAIDHLQLRHSYSCCPPCWRAKLFSLQHGGQIRSLSCVTSRESGLYKCIFNNNNNNNKIFKHVFIVSIRNHRLFSLTDRDISDNCNVSVDITSVIYRVYQKKVYSWKILAKLTSA